MSFSDSLLTKFIAIFRFKFSSTILNSKFKSKFSSTVQDKSTQQQIQQQINNI